MKYIRTKDGKIIKILQEGIDEFGKYGLVDEENCIRNYDDLKQADTIEKLYDEFVYEILTGEIEEPMYRDIHNARINIKTQLKIYEDNMISVRAIYGAIWINGKHDEPILKSVTKMKGILPNGEIDWELL